MPPRAKKPPLTDLKVPVAGSDSLIRYGGFSAYPSRVLQQKGPAYLEEIEGDSKVASALHTRAIQAILPGYSVKPATNSEEDLKAARFVEDTLKDIEGGFIADLIDICDAIGKGFYLGEPIFSEWMKGEWAGYYRLLRLKQCPHKYIRFDFDEAGNVAADGVVLRSSSGPLTLSGEERRLPYARFLHVTFGKGDNPYGDGLDIKLAFWTWIKNNAAKFRALYIDKFASPTPRITLPKGAGTTEKTLALDIIRSIQQETGIVVPLGYVADFLEAIRSGDADYESYMSRCNREIDGLILGAQLSTDGAAKGQGGSYALGKQHGGITDLYAYADALWLECAINQKLVPLIVDVNFDVDKYPTVVLLDDNIGALISVADALLKLSQSGYPVPLSWVSERLNIPVPLPGEETLKPATIGGGNPQAIPATDALPRPDNRANMSAQPCPVCSPSASRDSSLIVHRSSFSADASAQAERAAILDRLESETLTALGSALRKLFDQPLKEMAALPEGQLIGSPPKLILNVGEIKRILADAALSHYFYGKKFAVQEVESKGTAVPAKTDPIPDLPANFRLHPALSFSSGLCPDAITASRCSSFIVPRSSFADTPGDTLTLLARDIPLTKIELDKVIALYQNRFLNVAGLIKADVEKIWINQIISLKENWILRDFERALTGQLDSYAGPITTGALPANRIELTYRNFMNQSYAEGKNALYSDPDIADQIAGFTYIAILDSRVRPTHESLNGVSLPKDDPFWARFTPPIFHNCRCDREPVLQSDIATGLVTWTESLPDLKAIETFN
jgi:SPP1 gp7 family putative phage head morphogenesis protein